MNVITINEGELCFMYKSIKIEALSDEKDGVITYEALDGGISHSHLQFCELNTIKIMDLFEAIKVVVDKLDKA